MDLRSVQATAGQSQAGELATSRYQAFMFDMDGTILNSILVAERIWGAWAERQGIDVAAFLPTIHGARAVDTIAGLRLAGIDAQAEAEAITHAEISDTDGIVEIPGAAAFLRSLPSSAWAIVTSAPRALAIGRLQAAGLPVPAVMITAEDVKAGKPQPDCYLLAAAKLGVAPADCLIFEDAAIGIAAAVASGAQVVVVTSTHSHALSTPHAVIPDYAQIAAAVDEDGALRLARMPL